MFLWKKKQSSSSNCFCGRMECVCGKSASHISTDNRWFFSQSRRGKKNCFSQKVVLLESKIFPYQSGVFKCKSKFSPKFRKIKDKSYSGFVSVWTLDAENRGSTPMAKRCEQTPEISLSKSGNRTKKLFFYRKKICFLKVYLWTHGMQFWQICQFRFARNPKDSCSQPKS